MFFAGWEGGGGWVVVGGGEGIEGALAVDVEDLLVAEQCAAVVWGDGACESAEAIDAAGFDDDVVGVMGEFDGYNGHGDLLGG